jgi:hypothetical protein
MDRARIVAVLTVIAWLYLPGLRVFEHVLLDHVERIDAPESTAVLRPLAELGLLAAMLAFIGWHRSWAECGVSALGMAACTVFLYWVAETLGAAQSNQPVDEGSWFLYLPMFAAFYAGPLFGARGAKWVYGAVVKQADAPSPACTGPPA